MPSCFWPHNEPRIHAMVTSISQPFDAGRMVEIKLKINNRQEIHGEVRFEIPAADAHEYRLGDVYAAYFQRVKEGP